MIRSQLWSRFWRESGRAGGERGPRLRPPRLRFLGRAFSAWIAKLFNAAARYICFLLHRTVGRQRHKPRQRRPGRVDLRTVRLLAETGFWDVAIPQSLPEPGLGLHLVWRPKGSEHPLVPGHGAEASEARPQEQRAQAPDRSEHHAPGVAPAHFEPQELGANKRLICSSKVPVLHTIT